MATTIDPNTCTGDLSTDFTQKCDDSLARGIKRKIVLVNNDDIDKSKLTANPYTAGKLEELTLLTGKTGIFVVGFAQENSYSVSFSANDAGRDGTLHSLIIHVPNATAEERAQINNTIMRGMCITAVVEKKNGGIDGAKAFEVLGFENGMVVTDLTVSSTENNGDIMITLTSDETAPESGVPLLLGTSYATTKAAFENKFATAAPSQASVKTTK